MSHWPGMSQLPMQSRDILAPRAAWSRKLRRCRACCGLGGTGLIGACRTFASEVGDGCQHTTEPGSGAHSLMDPNTSSPGMNTLPPLPMAHLPPAAGFRCGAVLPRENPRHCRFPAANQGSPSGHSSLSAQRCVNLADQTRSGRRIGDFRMPDQSSKPALISVRLAIVRKFNGRLPVRVECRTMWGAVLALALVAGLDPVRIGIAVVLFARPRPVLHLVALWLGGMAVGVVLAVAMLFGLHDIAPGVMHRVQLATTSSTAGHIQIAMGILALVVAAA